MYWAAQQSLLKSLCDTGYSADPWGMQLLSDCQLDLVPLIADVWVWWCNQLFAFCIPPTQTLSSPVGWGEQQTVGVGVKACGKSRAHTTRGFPLLHRSSHFTTGDSHVGQTLGTCGISKQSVPTHLLHPWKQLPLKLFGHLLLTKR